MLGAVKPCKTFILWFNSVILVITYRLHMARELKKRFKFRTSRIIILQWPEFCFVVTFLKQLASDGYRCVSFFYAQNISNFYSG